MDEEIIAAMMESGVIARRETIQGAASFDASVSQQRRLRAAERVVEARALYLISKRGQDILPTSSEPNSLVKQLCLWSLIDSIWHVLLVWAMIMYGYMDYKIMRVMREKVSEATMCFWQRAFEVYFYFRIFRFILLMVCCCNKSHRNDRLNLKPGSALTKEVLNRGRIFHQFLLLTDVFVLGFLTIMLKYSLRESNQEKVLERMA